MNESIKSTSEANTEQEDIKKLLLQHPTIVDFAVQNLSKDTKKGLEARFAQINEDEQNDINRPQSRKHTEEEYEQIRKDVAREAVERDLLSLDSGELRRLNDEFASIEWDERRDNPDKPKHTKKEYDEFRRYAVARALETLNQDQEPASSEPDDEEATEIIIDQKTEKAPAEETKELVKTTIASIEDLNITEATTEWLKGELEQINWDEKKDYENPNKNSHKHTREEYEAFRKEAVHRAINKDLAKLSKEARQKIKDDTVQIKEDEKKDYENPFASSHKHTKEEYYRLRRKVISNALLGLTKKPEIITEEKPSTFREDFISPAVEEGGAPKDETILDIPRGDDLNREPNDTNDNLELADVKKEFEGINDEAKELKGQMDTIEAELAKILNGTESKPESKPKDEKDEKDEAPETDEKDEKDDTPEKDPKLAEIDEEIAKIDAQLAELESEKSDQAETMAYLSEKRRNLDRQIDIIDGSPLLAVDVDVTRDRDALANRLARKVEAYNTRKKSLFTRIWRTKLFPKRYTDDIAQEFIKNERTAKVSGERVTLNEMIARKSKGLISRFVFGAADSMQGIRNRLEFDERINEADQETTDKVRGLIEEYVSKRPKDGENLDDLKRDLKDKVKQVVSESLKDKKDKMRVGNYDEIAERAYKKYNDYIEAATQSRCKAEHDLAMAAVMTGFKLYFGEAHDPKLRDDILESVESVVPSGE